MGGWDEVVFTNHQIDLNGQTAIAMGSYVFTCATTGEEAKVEYTFGYKRNADGKARIFLHHSSVPYAAAPAAASAPPGERPRGAGCPGVVGQRHQDDLEDLSREGRLRLCCRRGGGRAVRLRSHERALQAHQGRRVPLPPHRRRGHVLLCRLRCGPGWLQGGWWLRDQRRQGLEGRCLHQPPG